MPKNNQVVPGQASLFETPNTGLEYGAKSLRTWQDIEAEQRQDIPTAYGHPGIYVDTRERAVLLSTALEAFGRRNQRLGFDVASRTRPYSPPIWGRYEEMTPTVIEGAQRNVEEFEDQAKRSFWQATGFVALRGSGVMREEEIDPRARKMWRDFSQKYGDPQNRTKRDRYRKSLNKQIKY